jgi:hypothetical protein
MASPISQRTGRRAMIATAALLAAAAITWAAFPLSEGRRGTSIALIAACWAGVLSIVSLALTDVRRSASALATPGQRAAQQLTAALSVARWADLTLVAVLVLEAVHPARAWHTAVLGLVLLCYLFATHLAETHAGLGVLRGQLPLLAAGVGLLALSVGAAALPGVSASTASLLAGAATVIAAVGIGVLVVPGTRTSSR